MRVALATQDMTRVDAHLGWARHFMIYDVSAEGYHYIETVSFSSGLVKDGDHGKLVPRIHALKGCSLVFVVDAGPDGEHGLMREKMVPMRQFANQPIALALDALRDNLRSNPVRWLRDVEQRHRLKNGEEETRCEH